MLVHSIDDRFTEEHCKNFLMTCIQNSKRRADSALNPRKRESRAKSAPQYGFPKRIKVLPSLDETGTTPDTNQTETTLAEESLESKFAISNKDADCVQATITSEPNTIIFGSNTSSALPSFGALIESSTLTSIDASFEKETEKNEEEAKRVQSDGEASGENTDSDDDSILAMRVAVGDVDTDPQQKKKIKLKQRKPKSKKSN